MALFSVSNLLSFILPSKPSPPPPSMPPTQTNFSAQKPIDASRSVATQQREGRFEFESSASLSGELASVICPSLAYSNTLFCDAGFNVEVTVEEGEPEDSLVNRFRREVLRAGVIQECKRRRYYETSQDERKRKNRDAAKRNRRRRPQSRFSPQNKREGAPENKDDDEDNWEWSEGDDVPF